VSPTEILARIDAIDQRYQALSQLLATAEVPFDEITVDALERVQRDILDLNEQTIKRGKY